MRLLNLPGAPILLPRVGGRTDPAAALRAVCLRAVDEVLDDSIRRVIVLAAGDETADWSSDLPDPIGRLTGAAGSEPSLPLPLAVGRRLVGHRSEPQAAPELILRTVAGSDRADDDADLIIGIADGSALAHPGGPAAVHPRADDFDRQLVRAWRSGDPATLAALDRQLATEVMATGGPVWQQLARSAGGSDYQTKINFADAPFGVFYLVANWT
ncbi:class III extradiol ring-cleavage dioxygenase family protein [Microlunatus soli]|uniref:Catalytic LigB subunit of aromatic ring-opening dioxygenase n=1 Tax=Microlunatus soli TaxID=630515 RepID=A0A1H1YI59_9ACTN|nr:hypothetical protein [Microlunatus soli]SDT20726.1 hypothetical protein SAMN04489812_4577 [Microlunatus soli]